MQEPKLPDRIDLEWNERNFGHIFFHEEYRHRLIQFYEVEQAFYDPHALIRYKGMIKGEPRYSMIADGTNNRLIYVIFTTIEGFIICVSTRPIGTKSKLKEDYANQTHLRKW